MSALRDLILSEHDAAVSLRHEFHADPELGYHETRTSERVRQSLHAAGVEHCGGLAGGTGVLGFLPATRSGGGCVALRADMDALPITEQTGLPYASQNSGVMHACGHDGHTTILLRTASLLARQEERPNDVLFVFQPAEEGGAGGKRMVDDGVLAGRVLGRKADLIYGLHGWTNLPVGAAATRNGPLMAAATQMEIVVRGKGSHAAYPHLGIDTVVVASHIVTALQTVASRNVGPLESVVVTIGKIDAGVAHNVIPETARLNGTLRTLNEETTVLARAAVERIVGHTAAAFGATAEVHWETVPYPVTANDAGATDRFRRIARETIGPAQTHEVPEPSMGGEDFSFYGREVPACFFFLGLLPAGQESYPNLHSSTFDFNDDALTTGIDLMTNLALAPL